MTVDGCVYERSYIEQWIRHRQQQKLRVTSPATNQELPSHRLVSLSALQKAIEAYLAHRPELRGSLTASRSFEEAAQMLQSDLLEKQAAHVSAEDELSLLRDSNEALFGELHNSERLCTGVRQELEEAKERIAELEKALADSAANGKCLEERCRRLTARICELEANAETLASVPASVSACSQIPARAASAARADADLQRKPPSPPAAASSGRTAVMAAKALPNSVAVPKRRRPSGERGEVSATRIGLMGRWTIGIFVLLLVLVWVTLQHESHSGSVSPGFPPSSSGLDVADGSFAVNGQAYRPSKWDESAQREERRREDRRKRSREEESTRRKRKGEESLSREGDWDGVHIEAQISQLRGGNLEEKTQAALVLSIMATASTENQAAIVRAGAVGELVELLSVDAPEARGQAAVALRALAANNTYNKVAIVRAGAIPPLIRLLKEDELAVQEVAAGALQTLAETSNQVEIAQAGAIVPLVALLKDDRSGVREEAAGALVILALNADNQVAIAQVGAIPMLVELLQDEVAEVREQAAAALRNLAAENVDNQVAIAKAGAFTPLAELLKDDLPGVREEALAALRNLAGSDPSNGLAIADAAAAARLAIRAAEEATERPGLVEVDIGPGQR